MAINNPVLHEKVGLSFEFKKTLTSYLNKVIETPEVLDYDVEGNDPVIRQNSVERVVLATPAMKFEYKAGVYRAFKLIDDALLANSEVALEDKEKIDSLTNLVSRYVGLAGDDDFHFMVAAYTLSEAISEALNIDDSV
jgi:hypothetical protein